MNKIQVEGQKDKVKDIQINKDTFIDIDGSNITLNITQTKKANIFIKIISSKLTLNITQTDDLIINIFTVNTSLNTKVDIIKDNLNLKYTYSTINEEENTYKIDVNHLGNNINSQITSHGINLKESLSFKINAVVPKTSKGVVTNQDSKIILEDGIAQIKPNLLVDIDEVEANHSAYIGEFKEEDLFYLKTRGINEKQGINLLAKSFLMGQMSITFRERNIILEILKRYWR